MVSLPLSTLIKLERHYFFPPKEKTKMATPAKLPKTDTSEFFDVEGYVHTVTPTKPSVKTNDSYFNFVLQTDRTTFTDVVSYTPKNRRYLVQASEKKNPIKITNVKRALSKFFICIIYPYNIKDKRWKERSCLRPMMRLARLQYSITVRCRRMPDNSPHCQLTPPLVPIRPTSRTNSSSK